MTDTTASSDAKQSQPAASLSGSELDRLRELAERGKAADWGWVRADPLAILALLADFTSEQMERADAERQLQEALAERQQDRQRIADLEDGLRSVLALFHLTDQGPLHSRWVFDADPAPVVEQARSLLNEAFDLLSPEAQLSESLGRPSSGGDEE